MDARRFFGHQARRLRLENGYTHRWIGERVRYSDDAIGKMESGDRPPPQGVPEFLDDLYQTQGLLTALGNQARTEKTEFRDWVEQEQRATYIRTYDMRLIPGLLQTERYARVVFKVFSPWADDAAITRAVQNRLSRQATLDRATVRVAIEEAAIERVVGDRQTQIDQLARLLALPENVSVHIVPTSAGLHAGHDGQLTILRFAPTTAPALARTESRGEGIVIDDALDVARAEHVFDEIIAASLTRHHSEDWIHTLIEELSENDL